MAPYRIAMVVLKDGRIYLARKLYWLEVPNSVLREGESEYECLGRMVKEFFSHPGKEAQLSLVVNPSLISRSAVRKDNPPIKAHIIKITPEALLPEVGWFSRSDIEDNLYAVRPASLQLCHRLHAMGYLEW